MWVIYQFFAEDQSAGKPYGMEDLLEVTLKHGKLDRFLEKWDRTLTHMAVPPSTKLRDALFIIYSVPNTT